MKLRNGIWLMQTILSAARSPIYSHLSASLNGLTTIRSFGAQPILIKEFDKIQDNHSSAFYLFISTSRAFGFWLDLFCVMYIAVVTVSFLLFEGEGGGNVGLAITQALAMTGMVQWGMRQVTMIFPILEGISIKTCEFYLLHSLPSSKIQ